MRHRLSGRHFGRTAAHRSALYRSLALALFKYEVIKTTLPKAKELRRFAEPLITLAKQDSVAHRRLAFARLRDPAVVYTDIKSKLDYGDTMLIYSDGIGYAKNEADEVYSPRQLSKLLEHCAPQSSPEILQAINHNLRTFAGARELTEDMTAICIKKDGVD